MSFKLVAQVFDIRVGNPLRKMVLMKLADQANDEGKCWPSYESIAHACEISRRSVINHIKWLEKNNYLRIEKRYNDSAKKNYSNIYHLTLSTGANNSPPPSAGYSPPPSEPFALGSAGDSPLPSAGNAPPSAGDAPEPINEPITLEPINETEENAATKTKYSPNKKTSQSEDKVLKPDDVSDQTWSDLLKLRSIKKAPLTVTAWNRALKQIDLIRDAAGHDNEEIIGEWIEAGWVTVKYDWYMNRIAKPDDDKRFNIDNEDWSQSNSDNSGYHPSHSTSQPTANQKAKTYNPKTDAVIAGMIVQSLPNMTPQETMAYVAQNVRPGETSDETYRRLFSEMEGEDV